ncbi:MULTISPECIES: OmpA family protein [unclassified Bradyrhizobium]|uniref:OmpA family protein n=1 Tax=unclassified Bradyrhizobium TaxID=2631580 RepID=UPI0028EDEEF0|nr:MULTISPECIES: OmpA family protein [unclassified Bradyrhizobium]
MTAPKTNSTRTAGLTALLAATVLSAAASLSAMPAFAADDVSEDQIVRALAGPKRPLTRGLSMSPPSEAAPAVAPEQDKFLQSIRGRSTRSLSTAEREEIAAVAKTKPNIDLEITFDYNSANISQKSLPSVQALGRALTNAELKGSTFVVAGHTDAAGGEAYNQDLSERRADSIKRYLVEKFGIAGADLVTVGYGKSKLKDPSQPLAEVNRRVQVVNMQSKTAAAK